MRIMPRSIIGVAITIQFMAIRIQLIKRRIGEGKNEIIYVPYLKISHMYSSTYKLIFLNFLRDFVFCKKSNIICTMFRFLIYNEF